MLIYALRACADSYDEVVEHIFGVRTITDEFSYACKPMIVPHDESLTASGCAQGEDTYF